MEAFSKYISELNKHYVSGIATEHTYRGDLQLLLAKLLPEISVTNEPKRQACGAPDYILTKATKGGDFLEAGYIEAKDIGEPLSGKKHKEQFDRYKEALSNLIITDYLVFHFYREGEKATSIRIGEIKDNKVIEIPESFDTLSTHIQDFVSYQGQTIKSAEILAQLMAGKARLLADVIGNALSADIKNDFPSQLTGEYYSFQDHLIEDLDTTSFADIYAQTIAYGMFAARYNDPTLPTFSRREAAMLIPESSPFLRKLFNQIAGTDLDERLSWIVDSLVEIFHATDVADLLRNYGKNTSQDDPIIHFYETFLGEYDPKLRKSRGVWYTPKPVVEFIVRAVDDVLKNEFGLEEGLADETKTAVQIETPRMAGRGRGKYTVMDKQTATVHKVQILDPACGTGTFLAETIKYIHKGFEDMQGEWESYVDEHLIPRVNGFEILMASYAMAHMQLSLLLKDTGYSKKKHDRFNIYLTNSLQEHHRDTGNLFSQWLAEESRIANQIKRDTPVMVVMGNPPYSGESSNKGEWIMDLMDDYKKEPGGKVKLNERNPKWINDDYVKFLRYGQHFIDRNGEGILAFINPHGFLDNPTFRGMRWSLMRTYDKIYTIDLHGNGNKKETCPDGSPDVNVFDIRQGVSINIFIKSGKKKGPKLADVYHYDLYGKRKDKYEFLSGKSLSDINFSKLKNNKPMYFMVQKDFSKEAAFRKGFSLEKLFIKSNIGIVTSRDYLVIDGDQNKLSQRIQDVFSLNESELKEKHKIRENKTWKVADVRSKEKKFKPEDILPISYRPFDSYYIYYNDSFIERSRRAVMDNYLLGDNIGLLTTKSFRDDGYSHVFVTDKISEAIFLSGKTASNAMNFPLYIYAAENGGHKKVPNFDAEVLRKFEKAVGLSMEDTSSKSEDEFTPTNLFDYIYAALHTQKYREKYDEFLKTDYPHIPYPTDKTLFWSLVEFGKELRETHLLNSKDLNLSIAKYEGSGDSIVTRKIVKTDCEEYSLGSLIRVYINDEQYFENIPKSVWNFTLGGYQPAQKWLKDRKGTKLSRPDVKHYFKLINALSKTIGLMEKIDEAWTP